MCSVYLLLILFLASLGRVFLVSVFIPVSLMVVSSHVWWCYLPSAPRWPASTPAHRCALSHTAARICVILLPSLSFLALMSHTKAQVWPNLRAAWVRAHTHTHTHTHTNICAVIGGTVHTKTDSTVNYFYRQRTCQSVGLWQQRWRVINWCFMLVCLHCAIRKFYRKRLLHNKGPETLVSIYVTMVTSKRDSNKWWILKYGRKSFMLP